MKKLLLILVVGAVGLMAADGATVYKKCIACHGANGDKVPPGSKATITINSLSKDKIIEDVKAYKAGTLDQYGAAKTMLPILKSLSDEDIAAVAEHITTLKK